ncbi:hypothetical protein H4S02_004041 [Coemansia sp. RSA 2611]|nr:hypothetical protein H4S02_004041 [Coemansia sp. RSA 2611]
MQNPNRNFWSAAGTDASGKAIGLNTAIPYYGDAIVNLMYPSRNGMCFSYDNYNTVTSKRSLSTRGASKCIPRPQSVLPSLPDLIEGVFDDVNEVLADSEAVVKQTLATLSAPMLNKWFPTLANNNTVTYTASDIPEAPIVAEVAVDSSSPYSQMSAPALPSDAYDVAGDMVDSSFYSTPQDEPTPEEDYSASTVEVISEATSSAPSDAYSGESSAEADSASSSEEDTAAVPIPSHDTNDTYDASEAENYSQSYQIFDLGSKPDTSGLDGEGPKYPMPNPFPFTPGFIQMHGYSVKEIKAHYALATEFVGDMNADNYQSPYAKGAQSLLGTVADILSDVL